MRRLLFSGVLAALVTVAAQPTPAQAAPAVFINAVQYDSPGTDDGSNQSLNKEWVKITNRSNSTKTLTDWRLRDRQGHVYRFPTTRLGPGKSIRVHTGRGSNTPRHRYWRQGNYVWNNTGDRAVLKRANGNFVDACSWGDGDGHTGC